MAISIYITAVATRDVTPSATPNTTPSVTSIVTTNETPSAVPVVMLCGVCDLQLSSLLRIIRVFFKLFQYYVEDAVDFYVVFNAFKFCGNN